MNEAALPSFSPLGFLLKSWHCLETQYSHLCSNSLFSFIAFHSGHLAQVSPRYPQKTQMICSWVDLLRCTGLKSSANRDLVYSEIGSLQWRGELQHEKKPSYRNPGRCGLGFTVVPQLCSTGRWLPKVGAFVLSID